MSIAPFWYVIMTVSNGFFSIFEGEEAVTLPTTADDPGSNPLVQPDTETTTPSCESVEGPVMPEQPYPNNHNRLPAFMTPPGILPCPPMYSAYFGFPPQFAFPQPLFLSRPCFFPSR